MKINEKFLKGIAIMAMYFITAMQQPNFVWLGSLIVALVLGGIYYVKNYYTPSASQQGEIHWKDLFFALLLAVLTAVGDSVANWVINGSVNFAELWEIMTAAALTYLFPTFYQGGKVSVTDVQPDPNNPGPR